TATKLASSINIGGVSFDGSADIDLPGVNTKGNQDTTGNAATATKLQTACTINGVSFDGSKDIELNPRSIGTINSTTMSFSGGAGW
ncbi:phage tail protein, partial [Escherichia coli]